jgi:hypothetical protein
MDLRPSPGRLGVLNSRNSYGETRGHANGLLMAPVERDAIGGLDEPTKLAIFRGPKHPLKSKLTRNLRPAARSCIAQLRSHADHELDMLIDCERLLEEKIGLPFGLTLAE